MIFCKQRFFEAAQTVGCAACFEREWAMQISLAKQSSLLLGSRGVNGEVIVGIILARPGGALN